MSGSCHMSMNRLTQFKYARMLIGPDH